MKDVQILHGDALEMLKTLPDESVQMCCTSPPYYCLRDYGTGKWVGGDENCDHKAARNKTRSLRSGWDGTKQSSNEGSEGASEKVWKAVCPKCGAKRIEKQIGLEETPEEYINKLVAVFREVRRVLHKTGTLWVNIADSYGSAGSNRDASGKQKHLNGVATRAPIGIPGIKPKDLIGIPWMLAFALRADGWYLRQDIIWSKRNPMPHPVRDRCTTSHEYIFLLTKSKDYYHDSVAIRERAAEAATEFRNCRSVWEINIQPSKEKHFAAYPKKLVMRCLMAGTSEKGCCPKCRAPYERIVKKKKLKRSRPNDHVKYIDKGINGQPPATMAGVRMTTVGWKPTCDCNAGSPVPCVVLDPFAGTGQTAAVAIGKNRRAILIELSAEYLKIINRKLKKARAKKGFGL